MKLTIQVVLALLAFAGNSVLCRLALSGGEIDALGFSLVRLFSGALVLFLLLLFKKKKVTKSQFYNQNIPALMLFGYVLCFSYAYVTLETGAGALILFAAVQVTMMVGGLLWGQGPNRYELLGVFLASAGLVYWLLPYWGSPSITGFILMVVAGFCWGMYSLLGQKTKAPIEATAMNFIWTVPVVILLLFWQWTELSFSALGLVFAITSGVLASAIGYVLWYAVVPKITATQAAVLQLLVPILAALGGVIWLNEAVTVPLLVAGILVFGGVLVSQKK